MVSAVKIGSAVTCQYATIIDKGIGKSEEKLVDYSGVVLFQASGKKSCNDRLSKFKNAVVVAKDDGSLLKELLEIGNSEMKLLNKSGTRGAAGKFHQAISELTKDNEGGK